MTGPVTYSSRGAKRQRTETIASLPATFTNSLLAYAAARDPYINSILAHQHDLQTARERARAINFTHYSQSAWDMLNTKYARLSGSKAYEKAFWVVSDIGDMFDKILKAVKKVGGYESLYETRKSAVETMVEIMVCMVTAPMDEIGHRARNDDCVPSEMEEKLFQMMDYFDGDELAQLDEEGLTDKVRELIAEHKGYYMYERLNEVVEMLEGDYEEEGEVGEDGNDGEVGEEGQEEEEEEEEEEEDEDEDNEEEDDEEEDDEEELWGAKGVDVLRRLDEADARALRSGR
ncbi:hypothetical protein QBC32DRAFT_225541 [Pseudoneurospora amorphoporcata]|uniref:Uncharacterized protein n=1 Tax=Pseudoneurospora amorphoporcata TaxID=241081 RepID=A0AAN6NJ33_9PEZI|nr:hypothetical protein QBC32DRAFT_225541 [Pseudoneurospora amorphoporcata]